MKTTAWRRSALLAGTALLATVALIGAPATAQDPLKATYVSTGPIDRAPAVAERGQDRLEGQAALERPALLTPQDGETAYVLPHFTWQRVAQAAGYR